MRAFSESECISLEETLKKFEAHYIEDYYLHSNKGRQRSPNRGVGSYDWFL